MIALVRHGAALSGILAVGVSTAAPACGCIPTPPHVKAWVSCSKNIAVANGDEQFLDLYVRSLTYEKKRTTAAQDARWNDLRRAIEAKCGTFAAAKNRDLANGTDPDLAPRNQFEAFVF